jgi:hypothetical protein
MGNIFWATPEPEEDFVMVKKKKSTCVVLPVTVPKSSLPSWVIEEFKLKQQDPLPVTRSDVPNWAMQELK